MKKNKNESSVKKLNFLERKLSKIIEPVVSEQMLIAFIMYVKNDSNYVNNPGVSIMDFLNDYYISNFIIDYKNTLETHRSGINDFYVDIAKSFYDVLAKKGVEF